MSFLRISSFKSNLNAKIIHVSLVKKIFVWSLLFEPLQYFIMFPQNASGFGGNVSRLLQFIVIFLLFFKVLLTGKASLARPFSVNNRGYTYFFLLSIFAGIIGYLTGSYSYSLPDILLNSQTTRSFTVTVLRPFFEYFIALYYFVYFVVLAQYMLFTKEDIDYFFKWFKIVFLALLFIGFADLIVKTIYGEVIYSGINLQFHKNLSPGKRFHSFIGEPRAAFIYLFFGLALLSLMDTWNQTKKLTLLLSILIFVAIFFTQAISGILGLVCVLFLLIIYYFHLFSINKKILFLFSILLMAIFIVLCLLFPSMMYGLIDQFLTVRIRGYLEASANLFNKLDEGLLIQSWLSKVMNNVYPIWHLWDEVRNFNFFHLFFGNGLGSASIINIYYLNSLGVSNPNSGIVRMLYENGIFGILLFITAFLGPIKRMSLNYEIYHKLMFYTIVLLGLYFGHRSSTLYIFFGVALAILRYQSVEIKTNYNSIKS